MPGWMNHKLESRLLGEISATSDMQIIPPYGRKQRGTKEPLDEGARREASAMAPGAPHWNQEPQATPRVSPDIFFMPHQEHKKKVKKLA